MCPQPVFASHISSHADLAKHVMRKWKSLSEVTAVKRTNVLFLPGVDWLLELPSENCSSVGLAETWHSGTHPASWGHLSCLLFFSLTDRLRKAHWPLLHFSFVVTFVVLLMPSSVTHNGQRTLPEVSHFVRFPVLQNLANPVA